MFFINHFIYNITLKNNFNDNATISENYIWT